MAKRRWYSESPETKALYFHCSKKRQKLKSEYRMERADDDAPKFLVSRVSKRVFWKEEDMDVE